MAKDYVELNDMNDEEILEVEEVKENKIKSFVKKHYKKALVGLGLGAAFIAGRCLGRKDSEDDIYELDDLVPDTTETDGAQATE